MLDKNLTQDLSVLSTIIAFCNKELIGPNFTDHDGLGIVKDYSFIELKLARHDQLDYG